MGKKCNTCNFVFFFLYEWRRKILFFRWFGWIRKMQKRFLKNRNGIKKKKNQWKTFSWNNSIDQKGMDFACDINTLPEYVQWLIDKEASRQLSTSYSTTSSYGTVDLSSLGIPCTTNEVDIPTAISLLMNWSALFKKIK